MIISLQLYSIKEDVAENFDTALAMVKDAGYGGVEFAGYQGKSAAEIASLLQKHSLQAVSAHVGLDLLKNNLSEQIDYAKHLGFSLIICPWTDCKTKEQCLSDAAALEQIAKTAAKNGITLVYHSHFQEFTKFDGAYAMDLMLDAMPSVKYQPDVYWMEYAGVDAVSYIAPLAKAGRLCAVHAKEIAKTGKDNAYIGDGRIDFTALARLAPPDKLPWIVEQETFSSSHACGIKRSADGLRKALFNL